MIHHRHRGPFRRGLVLLSSPLAPAAIAKDTKDTKTTDIQILGLNDFHGQLEVVDPVASSGGRIGFLTDIDPGPVTTNRCLEGCIPAGGVEHLATHVRNHRAENPNNTGFVSAGDLIGATPLLSALFHDEPTIEAFNLMDLDYNGVGNHEFDEGTQELLRMQYGNEPGFRYTPARPDGCHPAEDVDCADDDPYLEPTSRSWPPTSSIARPARRSSRRTRSTASLAASRSLS